MTLLANMDGERTSTAKDHARVRSTIIHGMQRPCAHCVNRRRQRCRVSIRSLAADQATFQGRGCETEQGTHKVEELVDEERHDAGCDDGVANVPAAMRAQLSVPRPSRSRDAPGPRGRSRLATGYWLPSSGAVLREKRRTQPHPHVPPRPQLLRVRQRVPVVTCIEVVGNGVCL